MQIPTRKGAGAHGKFSALDGDVGDTCLAWFLGRLLPRRLHRGGERERTGRLAAEGGGRRAEAGRCNGQNLRSLNIQKNGQSIPSQRGGKGLTHLGPTASVQSLVFLAAEGAQARGPPRTWAPHPTEALDPSSTPACATIRAMESATMQWTRMSILVLTWSAFSSRTNRAPRPP